MLGLVLSSCIGFPPTLRLPPAPHRAPPPGMPPPPNPASTPPRPVGIAPDFEADWQADLERRLKEAHLHNQQELERRRMEGLLPQNLREE